MFLEQAMIIYIMLLNNKVSLRNFKVKEYKVELDLQSAGSSPNLTYTKISALDAIRIL